MKSTVSPIWGAQKQDQARLAFILHEAATSSPCLARTEKAGMFRRWVLDVLENMNQKPAAPAAAPKQELPGFLQNVHGQTLFRDAVTSSAYHLLVCGDSPKNSVTCSSRSISAWPAAWKTSPAMHTKAALTGGVRQHWRVRYHANHAWRSFTGKTKT